MKRPNIYLPVAALILAALAIPAGAQNQVPFKGALQGNDAVSAGPSPGTDVITTTGTGTGTHLGQFSFTAVNTVNIAAFMGTGSAHWIAANGDSIDTTFTASAEKADIPGYARVTEIHTINSNSGTGRFAGVQGSFIVERFHKNVPSADGTHVTFGSFHGTIVPVGEAH